MPMILDIDPALLTAVFEALIVLLLAIIALFNKKRTDSAAVTAAATTQTAVTNQAMAIATQPAAPVRAAYVPVDDRRPETNQIGTQFWMDAGYTGPEPDQETKLAYTNALVAYNAAVAKARALKEKYGDVNLNAKIAALAEGA